ncbi:hypothetical protein ACMBCN_00795 [Candidatus Liberibacter asiaticus]|nr:hypothetical protein [Candidatus Liberibacter asiaticus]
MAATVEPSGREAYTWSEGEAGIEKIENERETTKWCLLGFKIEVKL